MLFDRDYTKLTDELRRRSLQRSGILVMHYDNLMAHGNKPVFRHIYCTGGRWRI